jgi:pyrroloquinoline quinone biosynthesis protein D
VADTTNDIPLGARPAIARGMRLQWEPAQDAHVLLYPEGMVKLNGSAGAIMSRCNGVRTVADIVVDLERTYNQSGLTGDVLAFVAMAVGRHWLEARR